LVEDLNMRGIMFRILGLLVMTAVLFLIIACPDGEKMADAVFKKNGLNRLRVATTHVKPGGIILVKKKDKTASYIGEVPDFSSLPKPTFSTSTDDAVIAATNANSSAGFTLVLKKQTANANTN